MPLVIKIRANNKALSVININDVINIINVYFISLYFEMQDDYFFNINSIVNIFILT